MAKPVASGTKKSAENTGKLEVKVKKLEVLLAAQIERSAKLLKENQKLESNLQDVKRQRDCWHQLYRKINPDKKVHCDRQGAMVVYGEVDINELIER